MMGYLDEDNYLYISGRKKNIAIIGGRNVQLEEVEHALRSHSCINEARVYCQKDEFLGEQLLAEVVLINYTSEEELRSFLFKRIEAYKIPSKFIFLEEIRKIGDKISRE